MQAKHPYKYESILFGIKDPCTYEDKKINIVAFLFIYNYIRKTKTAARHGSTCLESQHLEVEAGRPEVQGQSGLF